MGRIDPDRLRRLALEAIEEAAAAAHHAPVPRTRGLALALAWLLNFGKDGSPPARWPFDTFWEALAAEREHDRWSAVNAATNAIYLALELRRDMRLVSRFEASAQRRQARATLPPLS